MKPFEIILISFSLAMDAFSVCICKGLSMNYKFKRNSLVLALSFSIFQMIMPILGFFLTLNVNTHFLKYSNLITFIILSIVGINMIKEAYNQNDIKKNLSLSELISLSIATSIDAMAVGITMGFLKVKLSMIILTIGITTFILSIIGIVIGKLLGNKLNNKASTIGGIILIILGIKFLLKYFKLL